MTSTVCFPSGNLAPGGSVIKATAIDPRALDADGVYRLTGRARVFTSEPDAIAAIKGTSGEPIEPGDVIVLAGRGPMGTGMEETYQLTLGAQVPPVRPRSRPRHRRALLGRLDRRLHRPCQPRGARGWRRSAGSSTATSSGSSSTRLRLEASVDLVGHGEEEWTPDEAARVLAERPLRDDVAPDPELPADTALWARLQSVSGGLWGGCVYDQEAILRALDDSSVHTPRDASVVRG